MLKYLTDLLASGDTFTLDVGRHGAVALRNRGLIAIDATGIVLDTPPVTEPHDRAADAICIPWTSIISLSVEISG